MKKRLISLIVAVVMLFSMLCPAAYADDETVSFDTCVHEWETPIRSGYSIAIPNSDFSFGVNVEQCKKCKWYKHVATIIVAEFTYYSPFNVNENGLIPTELATFWANVWYKTFGKNATAVKAPSGIGRKDLPGFEDEEGTAQVSKEGKLTYVVHPRLYLATGDVSVPYENCFFEQDVHSTNCKNTGNHDRYCYHNQISFNYNQYNYDYIAVDVLRHTRTSATFQVVYEVQNAVPGTYYVAQGQPLFRYRKSLGADEEIFYTPKQVTQRLPSESGAYDKYGFSRYLAYTAGGLKAYAAAKGEDIKARVYRLLVTCDPDESTITSDTNITITNNTWNGNIYVDNSTNLTYIYPKYTTVNEKNETVVNISNTPVIYNKETNKYYTYDSVTNNYYYINYEDTPAPSPSPTPSPSPSPAPSPSPSPAPTETPSPDVTPTPSPTVKPSTPETGDKGECCDHTGIIAILEEIRDKMVAGFADFTANFNTVIADFKTVVVAGFTDITNNITAVITDFKAAVVAGFADISANFTLAIENLNVNIQNIINKKFEDLPEPSPSPSPDPDQPSPSPEPVDPILPDTQNLIIPKMNSNTFTDEHGTWVASGSSKYSDVFDFFHAFDRSTSDFWETNAKPSYLQIEIPDPESYYIDGYIMRISKFNNRYAKEWTLQGSDDGKTWDDLDTQKDQNLSDMEEHKYTLSLRKAYKYYRLNMSNYASSMCSLSHFNLLGYDAKDVVTPTPAPTEPPSPTPSPSPAPTGKPDSGGDTNNFWNIFIGGGSDDGTDGDHKGIFWALVSLILALIAFFTNLFAGVAYLFPFLPEGVVMTINTCLFVVFLFVIIKFIMRSK